MMVPDLAHHVLNQNKKYLIKNLYQTKVNRDF